MGLKKKGIEKNIFAREVQHTSRAHPKKSPQAFYERFRTAMFQRCAAKRIEKLETNPSRGVSLPTAWHLGE